MSKTLKSGSRAIIFNVFKQCLAEYQAGKLLAELDQVYKRVGAMTVEWSVMSYQPHYSYDNLINVQPLKRLKRGRVQIKGRWWIVPDTKALLEGLTLIDKLVNADPTVHIRLPYLVLQDLSAMMQRGSPPNMREPAERLLEYIRRETVGENANIELQDLPEPVDSNFRNDAIVSMSLKMRKFRDYAVMITDDPERRERAILLNIPALSLAETRTLVHPFNGRYGVNIPMHFE